MREKMNEGKKERKKERKKEKERKKDRQTDRQTDRQKERKKERKRLIPLGPMWFLTRSPNQMTKLLRLNSKIHPSNRGGGVKCPAEVGLGESTASNPPIRGR